VKAIRRIHLPVLLAFFAGLPTCVVPVSPEWTDPQSNIPPTIYFADPAVGSILGLGADGGGSLTVKVVLADQNTQDKLYIRWIIDYPPFDASISRLTTLQPIQPGGNQIERPRLFFAPDCINDQIAHGFTSHRLLLAASDRPFIDDPAQLDRVPDGNFCVEATWQFELECQ
jgi:hypothetical protein